MAPINTYRFVRFVPLIGIGLFVILYVVAAINYPGGSNADASGKGFSLANNYWCDLLDYWTKNGDYNASRPFAMTAMILLCSSLAVLWYTFPRYIVTDAGYQKVIQISGVAAMIAATFVFTKYHDLIINVAGVFGAIAFLATFIGLFKSRQYELIWLGIFCFSLCAVNYYIFETRYFVSALPVIQKLTFLMCLFWFGLLGIRIYKIDLR